MTVIKMSEIHEIYKRSTKYLLRFNDREALMLDDLCLEFGLKRSDVIRQLIRNAHKEIEHKDA